MRDFSRAIVPVRTGYLRSTIAYIASEDELILTATASYSPYVEFGTRHARAQPFIRPSFYMVLPQLRQEIAEAVADGFNA